SVSPLRSGQAFGGPQYDTWAKQRVLKSVFELSYSGEDRNWIGAEIRRSGFQIRLYLLAIPAQEWVSLLFFFHCRRNRRNVPGSDRLRHVEPGIEFGIFLF